MWERVEQLLLEQGLTIADLSRMTGIGKSTFSGWRKGKYTPKSDKRQKVAEALGVSILYLDGQTDEKIPNYNSIKEAYLANRQPLYDVACGNGRINGDYTDEYVDESEEGCSWCRVYGDSMSPILLDGDYVKIQHMTQAEPSDITAVKIDGETVTIKRVEVASNGIWLRAENKEVFEDRFYSVSDVLTLPITIIGKVVEMKRKF